MTVTKGAIMNRKNLALGLLFAAVVLAACSSQDGGPTDEPVEESAESALLAPAPVAVPRSFGCNASAVSADTLLTPLPTAPDALILRPSGGACANHVVFKSGSTEGDDLEVAGNGRARGW